MQEKWKRHDPLHAWQSERFNTVKEKIAKGSQRQSWARRFLEQENSGLSSEREAASCVGMLALMGVLTVGGPLQYFLVSMVHHPEWLKKVQDEIDQVCQGRMPTLKDAPRLPILRACIKETIRWRPNIPTGVGHELMEDDVYEGHFIPKGTRILPLEWYVSCLKFRSYCNSNTNHHAGQSSTKNPNTPTHGTFTQSAISSLTGLPTASR